MIPVLIRLPEDLLEDLDDAVEEERQRTGEKVSRSALVRRAVREMLDPADAWVDPSPMDDSLHE